MDDSLNNKLAHIVARMCESVTDSFVPLDKEALKGVVDTIDAAGVGKTEAEVDIAAAVTDMILHPSDSLRACDVIKGSAKKNSQAHLIACGYNSPQCAAEKNGTPAKAVVLAFRYPPSRV